MPSSLGYQYEILKKTIFSVNNKVIDYIDKFQDEYII